MDIGVSRAVVLPSTREMESALPSRMPAYEEGSAVVDNSRDSNIRERIDKEGEFREKGNTIFADIIHFQLHYAERNGSA
jgi:hypothetical protein